jgi:CDP-diacylglycerol---serine O-phosphatidyltransferase
MKMRKVYILPNLFTTGSLFCGLLAIIHIHEGLMDSACLLILISAVLDGLDGKIARLTRTQSAFGLNYDSLSDLVAFGVAPSLLIYTWLQAMSPSAETSHVATGIALLFAICGALRLARFNVQVTREENKKFTGIPIPSAAGTVVVTYLAFQKIAPVRNGEILIITRMLPVLFVLLSCLMVSNLEYPSFKKFDFERKKPFDYLVSIIVVLCIAFALWQFRVMFLFVGFWTYIMWGIIGRLIKLIRPSPKSVQEKITSIK